MGQDLADEFQQTIADVKKKMDQQAPPSGLWKPQQVHGDWSKFPIIRGPIFGFPLQYGALCKFPPFWEQ